MPISLEIQSIFLQDRTYILKDSITMRQQRYFSLEHYHKNQSLLRKETSGVNFYQLDESEIKNIENLKEITQFTLTCIFKYNFNICIITSLTINY